MKAYMLLKLNYDMMFMQFDVISIHFKEENALNKMASLNADNNNPVESGGYGPLSGSEYICEEIVIVD